MAYVASASKRGWYAAYHASIVDRRAGAAVILEQHGERARWRRVADVTGPLGDDEVAELLDRAATIGEPVKVDGRVLVVGSMRLEIPDPRGAFANRDLIRALLAARTDGRVEVEIRAWDGERLVLRSLGDLPGYCDQLEPALNRWLGYRPPWAMAEPPSR